MSLINTIKTHEILSKYVENECCENDVCVTFDSTISTESTVIIKVDKFYNNLKLGKNTPPSLDCLIIRKCVSDNYGLTLVELKNIHSGSGFDIINMQEKFKTTLYDFIKERFKKELDINYSDIKLFFVSNQEIYKRDIGLKMEVLINTKFRFNEKSLMITPYMPNPSIKQCY